MPNYHITKENWEKIKILKPRKFHEEAKPGILVTPSVAHCLLAVGELKHQKPKNGNGKFGPPTYEPFNIYTTLSSGKLTKTFDSWLTKEQSIEKPATFQKTGTIPSETLYLLDKMIDFWHEYYYDFTKKQKRTIGPIILNRIQKILKTKS